MSEFDALKKDPSDRRLLSDWFSKVYPKLFVSAFRLSSGNGAMAEDICHDAMLAFLKSGALARTPTEEHALAYMRRSMMNAFFSALRSGQRLVSLEGVEQASEGAPEDSLQAQQSLAQLTSQLDAADMEILGMMLTGEPLSRIAAEMKISYSLAGVRVHRIRQKIKKL